MPAAPPLFLLVVTHKMSDTDNVPPESKVILCREQLVWTEGRTVGATELIMAPGPLDLHSDAGHGNQEGNLCHLDGFSGQGKKRGSQQNDTNVTSLPPVKPVF